MLSARWQRQNFVELAARLTFLFNVGFIQFFVVVACTVGIFLLGSRNFLFDWWQGKCLVGLERQVLCFGVGLAPFFVWFSEFFLGL